MELVAPPTLIPISDTVHVRHMVLNIPTYVFRTEYEKAGRPTLLLTTDDNRIAYCSAWDGRSYVYRIDGAMPPGVSREIYWSRTISVHHRIPPRSIFMIPIYNALGTETERATFEFESQPKFVIFLEVSKNGKYVSSALPVCMVLPNIPFDKLRGTMIVVPKCAEESARRIVDERARASLYVPSIVIVDIDEPQDIHTMAQYGPIHPALREIILLNVPLAPMRLRPLKDALFTPEPVSHALRM